MARISFFLFVFLLFSCQKSDLKTAHSAFELGDYERAIFLYNKILDTDPAQSDARYGLALSRFFVQKSKMENQLDSADAQKNWVEVLNEFNILKQQKNSPQVLSMLSMCEYELGNLELKNKNYGQAVSFFEKAVEHDSLNIPAMYARSSLYDAAGYTDKAIEFLTKIVKLDQSQVSAFIDLGQIYLENQNPKMARRIWEQGLQANPKNEELLWMISELNP